MPVPARSTSFADLLDSRFKKIYNDQYTQLPDRVMEFYGSPGNDSPTKDTMRFSQVGTFGDVPEFTGSVIYDDVNQGYDTTLTHVEYASGFQIERKLYDDALYNIMDAKPRGLSTAYSRTRQGHAAGTFNNAFSRITTWSTNTEALALCSNSHTTTAAGVSTTVGFDNLSTGSFNAVNLATSRILMRGFRDDRGNRISMNADMIVHAPDIYAEVYEVNQSAGKPDTANNNANVHQGQYKATDWEYLDDANNWFLIDSNYMKQFNLWAQRLEPEFAQVEDFDTLIGKWRLYVRYSMGHVDWRWLVGHQVA